MASDGGAFRGIADQARKLGEIVTPMRGSLTGAAQGLGRALTRATSMVEEMRRTSPRDLMTRAPVVALVIAAGLGFLLGMTRSRR